MIAIFSRNRAARRRLADIGAGVVFGVLTATAWASIGSVREKPAAAAHVEPAAGGVPARVLSVVDGDTFEARVATFPGQEIIARIRLAGVDAPELAGKCAAEVAAAKAAASALSGLIDGRRLSLSAIRGDKYFGRVVARVSTSEGDVAEALIADGHGRPYSGGRRRGWC